jgi:hypothetical protein
MDIETIALAEAAHTHATRNSRSNSINRTGKRRVRYSPPRPMLKSQRLTTNVCKLVGAAQIPRTRRKLYLGHGKQDVTGLYERHEVTAFLVEDAQKLERYLNEEASGLAPTLVKEAG